MNNEITAPKGVGSTGGSAMFDSRILAKSMLTQKQAAQFRNEARQSIFRDEETGARVVFYLHPDGRVLLDAVRMHDSADAVAKILSDTAESWRKTADGLRYDQPRGIRHALDVHVNLLRDLAMELRRPGETKYAPPYSPNAGDVARGGGQHSTQSKT